MEHRKDLNARNVYELTKLNLGGDMDAEVYEMTMVCDYHCFDCVKEHLSTMLRNNHCADWIRRNKLELFYGLKYRERLRDIRSLKTANGQHVDIITKLADEVDGLKQQLQQMQQQQAHLPSSKQLFYLFCFLFCFLGICWEEYSRFFFIIILLEHS